MTKRVLLLVALAACGGGSDEVCHPPSGSGPGIDLDGPMCTHLSSYRLFTDVATQTADPALFAYDLNTPLFSDYATKRRWMYIPAGTSATWEDADSLDLPVGSVLVKTFSFPHDLRDLSQGEVLVETRLLIHQASGWEAAAYTYDGTDDAKLSIAGEEVPVSWTDATGAPMQDNYLVPNKNQCLICHGEHDATIAPLGPKARHLNKDYAGASGTYNQLAELIAEGKLTGAPADMTTWPKTAPWNDATDYTLDQRARGYLDVNCSHCHNQQGFARTSGLDLSITSTGSMLGICKHPTATGPAAGTFTYDIVPGMPDQSIVTFRLGSTAPDIKMPPIARNLVHVEGLQLIHDWIGSLTGTCP
jgi:uncharacterized repeat protein (TIGR03806 family)